MKAGLISLGCCKNLVDSELVLGLLSSNGFSITANQNEADVIFINTCGFINEAKVEAINTILEVIKDKKENQKIVVMGCLVERYKDDLSKEIPEVDAWIKIKEYDNFGNILSKLIKKDIKNKGLSYEYRMISTMPYFAYVKIGEGCSNKCSYCAIPLIRGDYHSRSMKDIVSEVEGLVEEGRKEIVLIAQDTTRFGTDTGENVCDLLEKVASIPGIWMIRMLYLYPNDVTKELVEVIKKHKNVAPYFDIPMQHGSNKMLKLMNRRGTVETCLSMMKYIREEIPNAIFRTTLMVGFNHETEEDYNDLIKFIEVGSFDRLGVFKYSPEDGTPAENMDGLINDEELVEKRYQDAIGLQRRIAYRQNKMQIDTIHETIITRYNASNETYSGRSYAFAPDDVDGCIYIKTDKKLNIGDIVKVKITNCSIYDLEGEIVE